MSCEIVRVQTAADTAELGAGSAPGNSRSSWCIEPVPRCQAPLLSPWLQSHPGFSLLYHKVTHLFWKVEINGERAWSTVHLWPGAPQTFVLWWPSWLVSCPSTVPSNFPPEDFVLSLPTTLQLYAYSHYVCLCFNISQITSFIMSSNDHFLPQTLFSLYLLIPKHTLFSFY